MQWMDAGTWLSDVEHTVRRLPGEGANDASALRPDPYGAFFRALLLPAWETHLRRRPTLGRLEHLRHTQWRSLDELRATQLAALRRLLAHAYANVPFYRARLDAAGVEPREIITLDDLARLPILTRDEARAAGESRASTNLPLPTLRKQTSGTTGQPLLFGYEPDSEHWRQAIKHRAYEWAGYRPGDKVLYFWGSPHAAQPPLRERAKIALDRWMKRETYVPCGVMDEATMLRAVRVIAREKPRAIVCYTQAGAELARFVLERGLRDWGSIPIVCGAERLLPHDRAALKAAFGPHVFDTYGCREVMLIASECEAHDGLHVSMENLIVELVVTERDGRRRAARPGERGEVVITDLHNLGMPFIRYANGDVAVAGVERRCSCGRSLERIRSVEGRSSDTLRDARGAPVSGLAVSFLFANLSTQVRRFQLLQRADRSVVLRVVPSGAIANATLEELRAGCARLLRGVPVEVEAVSEMPRSAAGKHHVVVVERPGLQS